VGSLRCLCLLAQKVGARTLFECFCCAFGLAEGPFRSASRRHVFDKCHFAHTASRLASLSQLQTKKPPISPTNRCRMNPQRTSKTLNKRNDQPAHTSIYTRSHANPATAHTKTDLTTDTLLRSTVRALTTSPTSHGHIRVKATTAAKSTASTWTTWATRTTAAATTESTGSRKRLFATRIFLCRFVLL
jgi:hypothetical protein